MSKKLEGNGLWESSRMMLPEHREAIIEQNREILKKTKPTMHEEELEIIEKALWDSYRLEITITVVLFDELEDIHRTGRVTKIDQYERMIKLQSAKDYDLLKVDNIISVITL